MKKLFKFVLASSLISFVSYALFNKVSRTNTQNDSREGQVKTISVSSEGDKKTTKKKSTSKRKSSKFDNLLSDLTDRQVKLFEFVKSQGSVSMSDISETLTSVTPRTLRRDLHDLMDKKLISKSGSTKNTTYSLR